MFRFFRESLTEDVIPLVDKPPGSIFKGYDDYVVQDLVIEPRVIRYRRERWQTPDGQTLIAPLPPEVIPGSHFGPNLIGFIVHQYHHQHVTQPLLWEQLDQFQYFPDWLILRFGGSIGEYHPKLLCDRHLWRDFLRSRHLL